MVPMAHGIAVATAINKLAAAVLGTRPAALAAATNTEIRAAKRPTP